MAAAGTGFPATPCTTDVRDIKSILPKAAAREAWLAAPLSGTTASVKLPGQVANSDMQDSLQSVASETLWRPCCNVRMTLTQVLGRA